MRSFRAEPRLALRLRAPRSLRTNPRSAISFIERQRRPSGCSCECECWWLPTRCLSNACAEPKSSSQVVHRLCTFCRRGGGLAGRQNPGISGRALRRHDHASAWKRVTIAGASPPSWRLHPRMGQRMMLECVAHTTRSCPARWFPDTRRACRCKPVVSTAVERRWAWPEARRGFHRDGSSRSPGTCTDGSCERAGAARGFGLRARVSGAP